jgi:predicted lipoprotein with Yx(FWY)xxD motif
MPLASVRPRPGLVVTAAPIVLAAGAVAAIGIGGPTTAWNPDGAPGHLTAVRTVTRRPPVMRIVAPGIGRILATRRRMPLSTYRPTQADHRVHRGGACAAAWPPLRLARGAPVTCPVAGLPGTFGTIRRPDGVTQLTRNGLPLHGFAGDVPGAVNGDGLAGFRVVRS